MTTIVTNGRSGISTLEGLIERMYCTAVELHGDLGLSRGSFRNRAMEIAEKCANSCQQAEPLLERLVAADLYLATACAMQSEAAWVRFYDQYAASLRQTLRQLCRESKIVDDLLDAIWADLFMPDSSGRSRIGSYDGRASLTTWLRVVISNRVTNERHRKFNALRTEFQSDLEETGEYSDIDGLLDARRHETTIVECLTQAWMSLPPNERSMILCRYQKQLQLCEIGRLWGIHPSTVNRTLGRALAKVRREVSKKLISRLRLSKRALHDLTSTFAAHSLHAGFLNSREEQNQELRKHLRNSSRQALAAGAIGA
jgi:RNA polymerase sigma-70 factor